MTSMLEEEWINRIMDDYNQIKNNGASSGIIWQDILYLDFVYEMKDKEGLKAVEGRLYFKYNDKTYKVDISAIWDGKEYRIIEIEDLYEK